MHEYQNVNGLIFKFFQMIEFHEFLKTSFSGLAQHYDFLLILPTAQLIFVWLSIIKNWHLSL